MNSGGNGFTSGDCRDADGGGVAGLGVGCISGDVSPRGVEVKRLGVLPPRMFCSDGSNTMPNDGGSLGTGNGATRRVKNRNSASTAR